MQKLCACLAEHGVLLFTAGGVDGAIVGSMHGHTLAYSSLSDFALLALVERGGCTPVLMERDQYPLHHLVVMATKVKPSPPQWHERLSVITGKYCIAKPAF